MAQQSQILPFFAIQIIGKRDGQEDSYGICYEFNKHNNPITGCFVLADGMGGHSGGNVASQIAVDSVKLVIESGDCFDERMLRDSLSSANLNIAECIKVDNSLEGMGTTLVVLTIIDGTAFWVSVGDSPLYCLDMNNELHMLNEDHSMRPVLDQLVESGTLSKDHPDYYKKVTQLRSALTGENVELYDLNTDGKSLDNCRFLILSTDGIDTLSKQEIKDIIVANADNGAKEIATALVNAVDKKGSTKQDNTTLIVIDPKAYKTI